MNTNVGEQTYYILDSFARQEYNLKGDVCVFFLL